MKRGQYIFEDAAATRELDRLRALEALFDPDTRRLLSSLGDGAGGGGGDPAGGSWIRWRCLEVGAGAGSIARFMGGKVGPDGRVVAVDSDARFLRQGAVLPANVDIVEGDVRTAPLAAGAFDLAHARYVLIHNREAADVLRAMVRCLRPGGWLVLEEPDFSAGRFVSGDEALGRAFESVGRAIAAMFAAGGMDHGFGGRLGALLEREGLAEIAVASDAPVAAGGSGIAAMMRMSAESLREKYLATGLASAGDLERYGALAADPTASVVYYATVRATARKPA